MKSFLKHAEDKLWTTPEESFLVEFLKQEGLVVVALAPGDEKDAEKMADEIDATGIPFAQIKGRVGVSPDEKTYFLLCSRDTSIVEPAAVLAGSFRSPALVETAGAQFHVHGNVGVFPGAGKRFSCSRKRGGLAGIDEGIARMEVRPFQVTAVLDGWLGKARLAKENLR